MVAARRTLLLAAVVALTDAAALVRPRRIVDGTAVGTDSASDIPWFASLHILTPGPDNKTFQVEMCGGALISDEWVLTAAHCLEKSGTVVTPGEVVVGADGRTVPNVVVQVGDNKQRFGSYLHGNATADVKENYFYSAAEVRCHPKYESDNNHYNDICLVKLDRKAVGKFASPVALNFVEEGVRTEEEVAGNVAPGVVATALGFGHTSYMGESAKELMRVPVPVVDHDTCRAAWDTFPLADAAVDDTVVCTDGRRGDTCQGDSGGPLVNERAGVLIGLTSQGLACPGAAAPSIYTSVAAFQDWITETAQL